MTEATAIENEVFNFTDIPGYCNFYETYYRVLKYMVKKHASLYAEVQTPLKFVEVGSWLGHSTAYMAELIQLERSSLSCPAIEFDSIDLWKLGKWSDSDHYTQLGRYLDENNINAELPLKNGYDFFHVVVQNLEKCGTIKHVNLIQKDSLKASQDYEDFSLDFVYIDAGHTYEEVMKDIAFWWRKVKPNGILGGDDYNWKTVEHAVRDFAQIRGSKGIIKIKNSWLVTKGDLEIETEQLAQALREVELPEGYYMEILGNE